MIIIVRPDLYNLFRNSLGLSSSSWMMKKQTWASFPSWFRRAMLRTSLGVNRVTI